MNELYLALKMMTEPHHSWQAPPEPVAIVEKKDRPGVPPPTRLSRADEKALRNAVKEYIKTDHPMPIFWDQHYKETK